MKGIEGGAARGGAACAGTDCIGRRLLGPDRGSRARAAPWRDAPAPDRGSGRDRALRIALGVKAARAAPTRIRWAPVTAGGRPGSNTSMSGNEQEIQTFEKTNVTGATALPLVTGFVGLGCAAAAIGTAVVPASFGGVNQIVASSRDSGSTRGRWPSSGSVSARSPPRCGARATPSHPHARARRPRSSASRSSAISGRRAPRWRASGPSSAPLARSSPRSARALARPPSTAGTPRAARCSAWPRASTSSAPT